MTREEAIAVLKSFSENPLCSDKHIQAFNIAIDTMHKYQQIEEIYKNWEVVNVNKQYRVWKVSERF